MNTPASEDVRPSPEKLAEFAHHLRRFLHHGARLIWAERPKPTLWPATVVGWIGYLVLFGMMGAGGVAAWELFGRPHPELSDRDLRFPRAFIVVFLAAVAFAIWRALSSGWNTVFALTDGRVISADLRFPHVANSFWKDWRARYALGGVELRGSRNAPVLVISGGNLVRSAIAELAGLSRPREVATLIQATLGPLEIKDSTR